MLDSKSLLLFQQKAFNQLLAITEETPVVKRAELFGRASGMLAALKYITDEETYLAMRTIFLKAGVDYVENLGRVQNESK
ncbi:hypothetical protein OGX96_19045 [Citrobacter sp. Cpo100]|uniref:hypothetical protein n=1 Tax=Citrobacter sp. Cpo100 TaxID=2985141 RepID=UPI002577CB99|nr:hypothetical protein [Citrobacter sp. Cpo100]MDM2823169.1 hypothetical protein [Citrobacter sp. Cpo100]